jgi:hypothetical protein
VSATGWGSLLSSGEQMIAAAVLNGASRVSDEEKLIEKVQKDKKTDNFYFSVIVPIYSLS